MPESTYEQMRLELQKEFPDLPLRPLGEFGSQWTNTVGIWTGADLACMPDGCPIFCTLCCPDPDYYDGYVHRGFVAWLDARGWSYDQYDGGTYFLVPNSYFLVPNSYFNEPAPVAHVSGEA